jgi:hypothetical protein
MAPNFSFCVSYNQFSVIILSYKMFYRNYIKSLILYTTILNWLYTLRRVASFLLSFP